MKDFVEIQITPDYLMRADHEATKASEEAATHQAKSKNLYEHGKDLLASIMNRLENESERKSTAELERLARDTQDWKNFRKGLFEANENAILSQVKATNAERHFDAVKSALSYRKEELKRMMGE